MSEHEPIHWTTNHIALRHLVPNPQNPKYSDADTAGRLQDSLDHFGQFQPFVVNSDGVSAIDGHQRINAWIAHKGADFIVETRVPDRELTQAEIRKLILYSGKGTHGSWDMDMLGNVFEAVELQEFGGFTDRELGLDHVVDYDPGDTAEIGDDDLKTDHTCPKCGFEY